MITTYTHTVGWASWAATPSPYFSDFYSQCSNIYLLSHFGAFGKEKAGNTTLSLGCQQDNTSRGEIVIPYLSSLTLNKMNKVTPLNLSAARKKIRLEHLYHDIAHMSHQPTWAVQRADMIKEAYQLEEELGLSHKIIQ